MKLSISIFRQEDQVKYQDSKVDGNQRKNNGNKKPTPKSNQYCSNLIIISSTSSSKFLKNLPKMSIN